MSRSTTLRRPGVLTLLALSSLAVTGCLSSGAAQSPGTSTVTGHAAAGVAAAQADSVVQGAAPGPGPDHPNVLMVTVDDAAPGNLRYMPNVRRLIAAHGVTLTNGVAPTPICVPARASLLTGQYAHNHGAHTISGPSGGFQSFVDAETLPVWLQRAGYDTLFVGKYLNGYGDALGSRTYVPPGWSEWRATLGRSTYDYLQPVMNLNGQVQRVREYSSDLFTDYTVDLLSRKERSQRPWFMMVNYVAPHAGGPMELDDPSITHPRARPEVPTPTVAVRHRDEFDRLGLPRTPDMFEKDTTDKARASGTSHHWSSLGRRMLREANQQRIESLQAVDEGVARAIRTLRRTGQLRRTVISFSSDNGYLVGQHNRQAKLIHYEDSLEVPMVLRGPGIPRGRRVATQVTNADLPTTIAALTGATPTRPQDGIDIRPLLRGGVRDRVIPIQAWQVHDGSRSVYEGVRTRRWTFVRFTDGEEELYDHKKDPYQLSNLANRKRYHRIVKRMRVLTLRYNQCAGVTCHGSVNS